MIPTQQDILDNVELVRMTVNSMKIRHSTTLVDEDDLFSEGIFGLFKAFELFDPEKSSWKTFAIRKIKYAMLNAHRVAYKEYRQAKRFNLPTPVNVPLNAKAMTDDGEGSELVDFMEADTPSEDDINDLIDSQIGLKNTWGKLSYRQRHVIKLLSTGMTQHEVAEQLNVTDPAVFKSYHAAVDKIKAYHSGIGRRPETGRQEAR